VCIGEAVEGAAMSIRYQQKIGVSLNRIRKKLIIVGFVAI
jgi:hypothetical protein